MPSDYYTDVNVCSTTLVLKSREKNQDETEHYLTNNNRCIILVMTISVRIDRKQLGNYIAVERKYCSELRSQSNLMKFWQIERMQVKHLYDRDKHHQHTFSSSGLSVELKYDWFHI